MDEALDRRDITAVIYTVEQADLEEFNLPIKRVFLLPDEQRGGKRSRSGRDGTTFHISPELDLKSQIVHLYDSRHAQQGELPQTGALGGINAEQRPVLISHIHGRWFY